MKRAKKQASSIENKPMYRPAHMDLGFVILGYDGDPNKIQTTLNSISRSYRDAKSTIAVPEAHKECFKGVRTGGDSITSLINAGMEKPPAEWNAFVLAGVRVSERLDQRYAVFMENRLDIFYPLVWGKTNFIDSPLNGLTVHRDTYPEIGKFGVDLSIEICKMMWFLDASDRGCKFKAVAGCRMC